MRSLWKGLTPFAGNLTLKYFLRFGTNAFYQNLLRDTVRCSALQTSGLCSSVQEPPCCLPVCIRSFLASVLCYCPTPHAIRPHAAHCLHTRKTAEAPDSQCRCDTS